MAGPLIDTVAVTSGKDLTSLVEFASWTATQSGPVQVQFYLSNLTGTAANFDILLRRYTSGGTLIGEYGAEGVAKYTATATEWGCAFAPACVATGEVLKVFLKSSNAGDSAVSGTVEIWDATWNNRVISATDELRLHAPTIYVDGDNGNDLDDGLSWASAKGTVEAGFAALSAGGRLVIGQAYFAYTPADPINCSAHYVEVVVHRGASIAWLSSTGGNPCLTFSGQNVTLHCDGAIAAVADAGEVDVVRVTYGSVVRGVGVISCGSGQTALRATSTRIRDITVQASSGGVPLRLPGAATLDGCYVHAGATNENAIVATGGSAKVLRDVVCHGVIDFDADAAPTARLCGCAAHGVTHAGSTPPTNWGFRPRLDGNISEITAELPKLGVVYRHRNVTSGGQWEDEEEDVVIEEIDQ